MGKKILTAQDVQKLYFQGTKEIYIDSDTILLPGARDALKAADIRVIVKNSKEECIREIVQEICDQNSLGCALRDKIVERVLERLSQQGGD